MESANSKQRIDVVNALRAFAALFVAWGHFSGGHGKYLALSGKYGYVGVDVFFVISGFVIPWSLYRSQYLLRDFPRFLLKRNLRLYPPYVASIAISIVATRWWIAPMFHQPIPVITGRDLLFHLTYLNDIVGVPWINVVYWTLAIEFQWYLLIGLAFPLLASRDKLVRFSSITAFMLMYYAMLGRDRLIFHSIPIFLVGVFVFQYRAKLIELREMLGLIAVMVLAMIGPIAGVVIWVSAVTGLLIAFVSYSSRPLNRLGDVSYSLYLLHLPIGVSLIAWLCIRLPFSGSYLPVIDAAGLLASLGVAWVMYQVIEKPSQEWSSAVRFVHHQRRLVTRKSVPVITAE